MKNFSDQIVYQIYPPSFQDSNQDGIGDLKGIITRLDYLKDLGVDYLWLTPVFPSPLKDNGYDISDYRQIDPRYGTLQDMEELIEKAGERNIGIVLDMVFNHTSTEHEWFQKALQKIPLYQDYYFFSRGKGENEELPPTNWVSKFGGSAWKYVPQLKRWYLHLFDPGQADLNWGNPAVRKEMAEILKYWKEKGAAGFRFDVINLISKPDFLQDDPQRDGKRLYTDGPHMHEYLKELHEQAGLEDILSVGELVSTDLDHLTEYTLPENHELNHAFFFSHLKADYRDGDKWKLQKLDLKYLKKVLTQWQLTLQQKGAWGALFWNNHDQPRMLDRLQPDKSHRKEAAEMLAASMFLMRGIPYLFAGDEIGMGNAGFTSIGQYRDVDSLNYYKSCKETGIPEEEILKVLQARSRDNARTPMYWSDNPQQDFSQAEPWIGRAQNLPESALIQQKKTDSLFSFHKKLFHLRKSMPVLTEGKIEFVELAEPVFSYIRSLEDAKVLVLANFSKEPVSVDIPSEFQRGKVLLTNASDSFSLSGPCLLSPYQVLVLEKIKS